MFIENLIFIISIIIIFLTIINKIIKEFKYFISNFILLIQFIENIFLKKNILSNN
jgi:hypothetical protein